VGWRGDLDQPGDGGRDVGAATVPPRPAEGVRDVEPGQGRLPDAERGPGVRRPPPAVDTRRRVNLTEASGLVEVQVGGILGHSVLNKSRVTFDLQRSVLALDSTF